MLHDKGALAQTKFGARMVRAVMWKLSIEDDQGQATVVQLVRSEYSIGRTDENTIRLTERNISRRHARLVKQGAAWFLDDLGSYNGCFVNGIRVVDHQPVNVGDLIQLGDYRLELHVDEGVAVAPQHSTRPRRADTLSTTLNLAAQSDRLVMVVGPTPGREYMLAHAPQRIGRGEECDICVNHSSVSRWHADLQYVGSCRYEIIDHGSSNGIRINGVELRRGLLDARDLIELGDVVLKFIPTGQVYRPSPEESKQLAVLLGVDVGGPAPSQLERIRLVWRSLSGATRWGAISLVVVAAILLVLSQLVKSGRLDNVATWLGERRDDPFVVALEEAQKLSAQGKFDLAHQQLSAIPQSSLLRQDSRFAALENQWAENLLLRAASAASSDERHQLLRTVATSDTIQPALRRRAEDALTRQQEAAPDSGAPTSAATAADAAAAVPPAEPEASANPPVENRPSEVAEPPAVPADAEIASAQLQKNAKRPATATRAPATAAKPVKPSAGPSAADLALSGDKDSLRAARDTLRRKVSAGTATDKEIRLLRALCRQLGDTTCLR